MKKVYIWGSSFLFNQYKQQTGRGQCIVALLFHYFHFTEMLFSTRRTPSTDRASDPARIRSSGVSTEPLSCKTPLNVTTLILATVDIPSASAMCVFTLAVITESLTSSTVPSVFVSPEQLANNGRDRSSTMAANTTSSLDNHAVATGCNESAVGRIIDLPFSLTKAHPLNPLASCETVVPILEAIVMPKLVVVESRPVFPVDRYLKGMREFRRSAPWNTIVTDHSGEFGASYCHVIL